MATTKEIGAFGEATAAEYLKNRGFKIIKQNYYCRVGELDIIAADGDTTVFVEVKTRKSSAYGSPAEFVTYQKQQRIIKTALSYVGSLDIPIRFDVVEIFYTLVDGSPIVKDINHIENAFS